MRFHILKDQVKNRYFVEKLYPVAGGHRSERMEVKQYETMYFETTLAAEKYIEDYVKKEDLKNPLFIKEIEVNYIKLKIID